MMIEDFLHSSIALDIMKKTEARIDEDSSITFYPFIRTLKIVEAQSLGIFPIMFRCPARKDKYTRIAKVLDIEDVFLTTNKAVISLEKARELNSIGVVRGN